MRVLVVSPKFHPIIGGGETFALDSVEQLSRAGIAVAVATEPHPDRKHNDYAYPIYEIDGLSDSQLDVIQATDGLFTLLRDFKPDLLHVHGYFALLAVGLTNPNNIPVISSIHSTPVWGKRIVGGMKNFEQELIFAKHVLRFTRPKAITAANNVYSLAAERITKGSIPVEYMPYPILPSFFENHDPKYFRNLFELDDSSVLITLPSRIIERKGIREAVDALALLPDDYYLCLPCAAKPLDQAYWSAIQSSESYKSAAQRIIIPVKSVTHQDMPRLYAASNLVIMPSYYEGAPVATVETMAAKKPFIGADSQGINGFITDGENGLLVPAKNSKALSEAILSLAKDISLQNKFTERAARSVAHLTWENQLPRLLDLYEKYGATQPEFVVQLAGVEA